jgi:hypothetical protein
MLQNNKIDMGKLNELTNTLGMNKKDIEIMKTNSDTSTKKNLLSSGPPSWYNSGYYGTISIKDFM